MTTPNIITLYLKTLTGKNLSWICEKNKTIKELKTWLEYREGIPEDQSLFVYQGMTLDDDNTLEYYNMQNGDVITIILKIRGD